MSTKSEIDKNKDTIDIQNIEPYFIYVEIDLHEMKSDKV